MQRALSLKQRKRNRRNVQMTSMTLSVKMKFFDWQSRWRKKDRVKLYKRSIRESNCR